MRAIVWSILASVVAVSACGHDPSTTARARPASAASAIAQVSLRRTTVPELRSLLGEPDEQAPDGTLVYRFTGAKARGSARSDENESVRFRFEHGTLSRICRTRS